MSDEPLNDKNQSVPQDQRFEAVLNKPTDNVAQTTNTMTAESMGQSDVSETTNVQPVVQASDQNVNSEPTNQTPGAQLNSETKPKGLAWLSKKKLVVGLAVILGLAIVGGSSALAYTVWYQRSSKVLTDSLINIVTAKTAIYTGKLNIDSDAVKVEVGITSKIIDATGSLDAKLKLTSQGKDYSINGSAMIDKNGDFYFKFDHLGGVVAEAKTSMGIEPSSQISLAIDKLVKKIDGTWVKISSKDIEQYSKSTATSKTCFNNAVKEFKDDKPAINEITSLYDKHQFMVVKKDLGQKDGNFRYEIKPYNKELKEFVKGVKDTKIYKSLHECDKSFTLDEDDVDTSESAEKANDKGSFVVWIGTWSHEVTRIEMKSEDNGTATSVVINPQYNKSISISAPKSSISLSELQTYVQELMSALYTSAS